MPALKMCGSCSKYSDAANETCPFCKTPFGKDAACLPYIPPHGTNSTSNPVFPLPGACQAAGRSYGFTEKISGILFRPSETCRNLRDEKLSLSVRHYLSLFILYLILATVMAFSPFSALFISGPMSQVSKFFTPAVFILILVLSGLVFVPLVSIWIHLFVYLFGGRKGAGMTLKAVLYSYTPFFLISWIPLINWLGGIWSIVPQVIGIREMHEIPTFRVIAAIGTAMVTGVILLLVPLLLMGPGIMAVPDMVPPDTRIPATGEVAAYVFSPSDLPPSIRSYSGRPAWKNETGRLPIAPISAYKAFFSPDRVPVKGSTVISQTIYVMPGGNYPPGNAQTLVNMQIADFKAGKFGDRATMLGDPKIGDRSVAFKIRATYMGESGSNNYLIIFAKGDVLEEIGTGGSGADYELLQDMARRAAGRIP